MKKLAVFLFLFLLLQTSVALNIMQHRSRQGFVLTVHSYVTNRNVLQKGHVAKCREDDKSSHDAGKGVDERYSQGIPVGR